MRINRNHRISLLSAGIAMIVAGTATVSHGQNRGDRRTLAQFSASSLKSMKNPDRECIIIITVKGHITTNNMGWWSLL